MKWLAAFVIPLALLALTVACGEEEEEAPTGTPSPAATATATPEATPTPEVTPTPEPTPTPVVWSDGRIRIMLDKVERTNVLPPDITETPSQLPARQVRTPADGHDYVCVYLTIARIENVHVVGLGHGDEESTLRSDEGHEYQAALWNVRGVEFLDPQHLTGAYELVEGATVILVFETPKHEKPANLTFVYSFKETREEISPKRGQVDISL